MSKPLSEKIKEKKGKGGRPAGSRNRVSVAKSLEQARNTGMTPAQYKETIDHFIEYAEEYGLSAKNILDYLKEGVNLYKWLVDEENKAKKGEGPKEVPKAKDVPTATPNKGSNIKQFKLS